MSIKYTLIIQCVLAVLSGTATVTVLRVQKKLQKDLLVLLSSWGLDIFYAFWGMSAVRWMLLYEEIPAYGENLYLIFLDVLLAMGISALLTGTKEQGAAGNRGLKTAACMALTVISVVLLARAAQWYGNLNAAFYHTLQPESVTVLGFWILLGYLIADRILNRAKGWGQEQCAVVLTVSALVTITFVVYPVFETLLVNKNEFLFDIKDIWYLVGVFCVMVYMVTAALLFLVTERRCRMGCVFLWALSISGYLQGMLMNGGLFLMDGKKTDWSDGRKIANFVLWSVLLAGLTAACLAAKKFSGKMLICSSLLLCAMQMIGVVSVIPQSMQRGEKDSDVLCENYLSMRGMYELASEQNVIVFVLDTYDVDFLEQVLEKRPDFLEPLRGFTYYPDHVAQFSRTFPSIPYMFTEQPHFYDEPIQDYVNRAFSECRFWSEMSTCGYQYYLFEEDENIIGESVLKDAENFTTEGTVQEERMSFAGCVQMAVKIGGYRQMPYLVKNQFLYTADDINDTVVRDRILDIPMYDENDALLWKQLKETGLTVGDDQKAFRLIHTKGAHAPYRMNETGEQVDEGANTPVQMYEGCMRFVYDYLAQMQSLGVYEQAVIVITADHGENFVSAELPQTTNPILFIKPSGAGIDTPVEISDVMASQNDLLPTIAAEMDIAYDDAWGIDLLNPAGKDKTRIRYHYHTVVENGIQTKTRRYDIIGNSRYFENWIATDNYHKFGEFY